MFFLALLVGCHPYVSGGYEMSSKISGPLATMRQQPVASARPVTALTAGETAPVDTTPTVPRTYSIAIGTAPAKEFHVELGLHAHDVSGDSLNTSTSTPGFLASPRYLTGTTSLDFVWIFLRSHRVSSYIHVGPAAGMIVDKSDGSVSFGQAVRFGGGLALDLPVVRIFIDASQTELLMTSGPATGVNELAGIMVGLGLH
ncbi:MAG: hypothetical protein ABI678_00505 [Kofleriaceae bacterium]